MKLTAIVITALLVGGCANPLNRVTYDRYWKQGGEAERAGQLGVAEQAYYRALMNVDMGNLEPLLKSQALYNLGRVKRRVGKYTEAEDLLKQSLALHEKLLSPEDLDTDRCRIELSVALAAQGKWDDGARYLEAVLPHASRFSGSEREFMLEVLRTSQSSYEKPGRKNGPGIFNGKIPSHEEADPDHPSATRLARR
jgi:tetratricopeptide (TPR) repeat protein